MTRAGDPGNSPLGLTSIRRCSTAWGAGAAWLIDPRDVAAALQPVCGGCCGPSAAAIDEGSRCCDSSEMWATIDRTEKILW